VGFDAKRTREPAQTQDEPRFVLFLVLLPATAACVAAITALVQQSRDLSGFQRSLHIVLSVLALSWIFIQTIFTLAVYTAITVSKNRMNQTAQA
jgi:uncharacterized membrane protein